MLGFPCKIHRKTVLIGWKKEECPDHNCAWFWAQVRNLQPILQVFYMRAVTNTRGCDYIGMATLALFHSYSQLKFPPVYGTLGAAKRSWIITSQKN